MKSGLSHCYPVACHTDYIGVGSTFVAINGFSENGISFIPDAIKKGATCVVIEHDVVLSQAILALVEQKGVIIERVPNTRKALALKSAQAAGFPAKKLNIIGITGTKGKTTTAYLLAHILKTSGYKTALLSSVSNAIQDHTFTAPLTTAQPDYLHQFLKQCVDENVEWVVMEVAAQAVSLHRIEGIPFDAIIMTNIAREHLEFYTSIEEYAQAKQQLISYAKPGAPIWMNQDDARLENMKTDNTHWFGVHHSSELQGCLDQTDSFSLAASVIHKKTEYTISCSALSGEYNLYNVLAATAGALHAHVSWPEIQNALQTFPGIAGRLELYALPNGATAVIDHAHNPLSFSVLLKTLRAQTDHLIVLFGAGGERDQGRRPEMGRITSEYADCVIITTDNPRSEDPQQIVSEIAQGIAQELQHKISIELDRQRAIHVAYEQSHAGSIIALLGKGSEGYQV